MNRTKERLGKLPTDLSFLILMLRDLEYYFGQNKNSSVMTDAITIEELIQLKQEGKIGWCELALRSEHGGTLSSSGSKRSNVKWYGFLWIYNLTDGLTHDLTLIKDKDKELFIRKSSENFNSKKEILKWIQQAKRES